MKSTVSIFTSKIGKKLLLSFVVVFFCVSLCLWGILEIAAGIMRKEVYASYESAVSQLAEQFQNSLKKFESIATALVVDEEFLAFSQAPEWEPGEVWEFVKIMNNIRFFSITNDIESIITLYVPSKGKAISSRDGLVNLREVEDYSETVHAGKYGYWFLRTDGEGQSFLTLIQGNTYESAGIYATVDINTHDIEYILKKINARQQGTAFALFDDSTVITDNGEPILAKDILTSNGEGRYKYIYSRIESLGLHIGTRLNENAIFSGIRRFSSIMLVGILVSAVLYIGLALSLYRSFLEPFQKLMAGMEELEKSNLKYRLIWKDRKDEFQQFFTQFNQTASRLDYLINEVYKQKINLQIINTKLLQAQVNPHFLFNCLSFIYQCSKAENNDAAGQMALYSARYFRYTMRADRWRTRLQDELENLDAYIKVQQMRFPDKIMYKASLEAGLEDFMVPRLLLQPLVENAIVHGIQSAEGQITIRVSACEQGPYIALMVEDTGVGMTLEECERKNSEILNPDEAADEKGSYGVSNLLWRMKTSFGDDASMKFSPNGDHGLAVRLLMPKAGDKKLPERSDPSV